MAEILDFEGVAIALSLNAILLANGEGRYVGANEAALELLG